MLDPLYAELPSQDRKLFRHYLSVLGISEVFAIKETKESLSESELVRCWS